MNDIGSDAAKAQQALDAFLVDNQELEQINARLAAFNLFKVLRIEGVEIRHSNVLAWLLTPGESHGLGATFLRRFVSRVLMEHDSAAITLSPAQVELMSFNDVRVLREWKGIDILAHSQANAWCLLVENKIRGREGPRQLLKYLKRAQQEFPECQIIPVYLTLEGEDPSEEASAQGYMAFSHAQVLDLAKQIIGQNRSRVPVDAQVLLDHYIVTLRRLTMQDQKLIDLCKTIYKKHRDAIDLIVGYGKSSKIVDAMIAEIEKQVACEFVKPKPDSVWFLPNQMGELMPTQELTSWTFLPRAVPVVCWCCFWRKASKLGMILEVGPMADSEKRVELMQAVLAAGFEFGEAGLQHKAKFTRIARCYQRLAPDEDGEPDTSEEVVKEVVGKLWARLSKDVEKLVDVLRAFEWR